MIVDGFGFRLKSAMENAKIKQYELASLLNVTPTAIHSYMSDKRYPKELSTVIEMASKLNVTVSYLLGLDDLSEPMALTAQEKMLITRYRAVSVHTQRSVNTLIDAEYNEIKNHQCSIIKQDAS